MASKKGISAQRQKTIYKRQLECLWDPTYQPSILATPQEAPSKSHAYTLKPQKFGRQIHLLSTPERNAALIGLYHPDVIGLQEQRMLWPEPTVHPLWQMPGIDRSKLPPIRGLIKVAEEMGHLNILPRVKVRLSHTEVITTVFPWVGDLLWAVKDKSGQIFCVNWSIKSDYQDFKRPPFRKPRKSADDNTSVNLLERHEIEQQYYKDAGIRTLFISDKHIDQHVVANLRQMFLHHHRPVNLSDHQKEEILNRFKIAFDTGVPPSDVITSFIERRKYTEHECRDLFYQAIWTRKLRVDLFKPVLINLPMSPESRDVIDVYQDWFKELP